MDLVKRGEVKGWRFLRDVPDSYGALTCAGRETIPAGSSLVSLPPTRQRGFRRHDWSIFVWGPWDDAKGERPSLLLEGISWATKERLFATDSVERTPEYREALRCVEFGPDHYASVHYSSLDVADAGVQEGDVLIYFHSPEQCPIVYGRVREMSLEDYEALHAAYREASHDCTPETIEQIFPILNPFQRYYGTRLREMLGDQRKWGRRLKTWHSRVIRVQPFRPVVSQPIQASSDEAAIFELLSDVGGSMLRAGG